MGPFGATIPDNRLALRFALLFALAHAGAFAACLPVLTILVPLKAAEIDPVGKAALLGWTALAGAATASLVNIAAGALSDATKSRFGRRKPWIFGGALATVATYFLMNAATTPAGLVAGIVLFQIAFNLFLPALVALLPDEVPDRSKGRMAALLALGPPIGLGVGAMLAGAENLDASGRYAAVGALFFASTAPLLLFWRERPPAPAADETREPPAAPPPRSALENFARVWASRLFIQIGVATSQGFILFFVAQAMSGGGGFPQSPTETIVSRLLFLSTAISIVTALIVGALSDRIGHRKFFVTGSGLLIFSGMATFAVFPTWPGVIICEILYGLGAGLYSSAEVALAAELLPSRKNTARDLAILNLGNTLPQAIAPGLALLLVSPAGGYSALFMAGGAAAALGGLIAARIK